MNKRLLFKLSFSDAAGPGENNEAADFAEFSLTSPV
jgi:hypothetical protein